MVIISGWFSDANIIQLIDNRARDSSVPTSANVGWEEPIAANNSGVQTLTSSYDPGLVHRFRLVLRK